VPSCGLEARALPVDYPTTGLQSGIGRSDPILYCVTPITAFLLKFLQTNGVYFKEATMRVIRVLLGMSLFMLFAGAFPLTVAADKNPPPQETYPYEIANQKVLSGTVVDVQDYACPVTGTVGSHITLRYAGGTIEVHLAPAKFLKQYEIVINKGSQIQIQGSITTVEGKPGMLAKIVVDGDTTYAFRDAKGKPLW
jgi:hypothetical protein